MEKKNVGRPVGFKLSKSSKKKISLGRKGTSHSKITKNKIASSVKRYHKSTKPKLVDIIGKIVEDRNYNLTKRIPYGDIRKIADIAGCTETQARRAADYYRERKRLYIQKDQSVIKCESNILLKSLRDTDQLRPAQLEGDCIETMKKQAMDMLPRGGECLVIGTPTSLCAVKHPSYSQMLIDDESSMVHILLPTCDHLTMVIGNGVNPLKAKHKADNWVRMYTMRKSKVFLDRVDSYSYTRWVSILADKHSILKVFLLTSGSWNGSKYSLNKYGLNVDFKSPSIYLTSVYSNLHILALKASGSHKFEVMYVHNGIEKTLSAKPAPRKAGH